MGRLRRKMLLFILQSKTFSKYLQMSNRESIRCLLDNKIYVVLIYGYYFRTSLISWYKNYKINFFTVKNQMSVTLPQQ